MRIRFEASPFVAMEVRHPVRSDSKAPVEKNETIFFQLTEKLLFKGIVRGIDVPIKPTKFTNIAQSIAFFRGCI